MKRVKNNHTKLRKNDAFNSTKLITAVKIKDVQNAKEKKANFSGNIISFSVAYALPANTLAEQPVARF